MPRKTRKEKMRIHTYSSASKHNQATPAINTQLSYFKSDIRLSLTLIATILVLEIGIYILSLIGYLKILH